MKKGASITLDRKRFLDEIEHLMDEYISDTRRKYRSEEFYDEESEKFLGEEELYGELEGTWRKLRKLIEDYREASWYLKKY